MSGGPTWIRTRDQLIMSRVSVAEFVDVFTTRYATNTDRPGYYVYPTRLINRLMGHLMIAEVGPQDLEAFRATRLQEGAARSTINRNVAVLSKVLKIALAWGYRTAPIPKGQQFREPPGRVRFLSSDEARKLV